MHRRYRNESPFGLVLYDNQGAKLKETPTSTVPTDSNDKFSFCFEHVIASNYDPYAFDGFTAPVEFPIPRCPSTSIGSRMW
ncbi:MAG: hypothetical protein LH650_03200 [Chloroflexi bacterium]|nr:hypothetical protein [Chloroflexota bacterium]